jgi:hypothetical protein
MITPAEMKLLRGLTKESPMITIKDQVAYLHSTWFTVELALELLDPSLRVETNEYMPVALEWRNTMPSGEGEFGQPVRTTDPTDGATIIKLLASSGTAKIHTSIYDVLLQTFPDVEFRVNSGEQALVSIYSAGKLIGGVAQVRI